MKLQKTEDEEMSRMPHAVGEAVEALKSVPEADPVLWARHRDAYLLAAATQAEVEHQRQAVAARKLRVSSALVDRRHRWKAALRALRNFRIREVRPMMTALRLVMMVALLWGGTAGTVSAARDSLPGSLLYPLKIRLEQWELARVRDAVEVSERALDQSQTRFSEMARLAGEGRAVPEDVAVRYQEQLQLAVRTSESLEEPLRLQTQSHISDTLRHQLEAMIQIAAKVKGDGEDDDQTVRAMIRTMEETHAQLGIGQGRPEVEDPGSREQPGPQDGAPYGPGETDGNGESYGPGDGEGPSGPNDQDAGSGPGPQQHNGAEDNDESTNGPDDDRGQGLMEQQQQTQQEDPEAGDGQGPDETTGEQPDPSTGQDNGSGNGNH